MRDPKLEGLIERLTALLDRWDRFYAIFEKALKGKGVRAEEAEEYRKLRSFILDRYGPLLRDLQRPPQKDDLTVEILSEIEGVEPLAALPAMARRRYESQLQDAQAALRGDLEGMEAARKALEPLSVFEYRARRLLANRRLVGAAAALLGALLLWALGAFHAVYRLIASMMKT